MSLNNEFATVPRTTKNYRRFIIHYRKPTNFSSFFEYHIECEHNEYNSKKLAGNKRFQLLVSTCLLCPLCPTVFSEHYHQETRKCNTLCIPERLVFQPSLPIHDCSRHYILTRQQIIPSRITYDYSPHFTSKYSWYYALNIIHGATCFPPKPVRTTPREPRIPKRLREKSPKKKRKRRKRRRKNRMHQLGQFDSDLNPAICNSGDGLSEQHNSPGGVDA
jgi:hypothetical protein